MTEKTPQEFFAPVIQEINKNITSLIEENYGRRVEESPKKTSDDKEILEILITLRIKVEASIREVNRGNLAPLRGALTDAFHPDKVGPRAYLLRLLILSARRRINDAEEAHFLSQC